MIDGFNAAVLRIPQSMLYVAVRSNSGIGNDAETTAQAASIVLRPFHYEIIKRCGHRTQSNAE